MSCVFLSISQLTSTAPRGTPELIFVQLIPKRFQFDDMYPEVIDAILEQQRVLTEYVKDNPDCGIDPRCFIVIDDCVDDRTRFSKPLQKLYIAGRHFNVWLIQVQGWLDPMTAAYNDLFLHGRSRALWIIFSFSKPLQVFFLFPR